ncbi:MAG: UDP-glucose/GDP-mannose dehydrogenase family protein [Planctomycetota bacterium]|nr:UDP-glucose/GDP-mannose dehydrogenase family protein [Planctomycetota bacterium]
MPSLNLAIIGTGHVGLVTGTCFAEKGHRVICVDSDTSKIETLRQGGMPIYEPGLEELVRRNVAAGRLSFSTEIAPAVRVSEIIFICVGTPPTPTGQPDLSFVEAVSREIARNLDDSYRLIVEKSTVPVRTGEHVRRTLEKYAAKGVAFDVASNPEFLSEGTAVRDTLTPDRIVIGASSKRAEEKLRSLFETFNSPIIVTDINSAELIKHASNSFLAMKVSFINAVAAICEECGANVEEVARGMGMDKRIGRAFLRAGAGYGGFCFPKDVEAFVAVAESLGYQFDLLRQVQEVNVAQRERIVRKIDKELWVCKDKTVGLLGLSFKPDTDDVRESPALFIASTLIGKGARVRAYDPKAIDKARKAMPELTCCADAYEAAKGADCVVLMTEWEEFRRLDLDRLRTVMAHPTLIDCRNVFEPASVRALGFTYRSVGRP